MRKQENPCRSLLVAVIFLMTCVAAKSQAEIKMLCEENDGSCKQCISAHPMCSWCGDLDNATLIKPVKRCTLHSQNLISCKRSGYTNVTVINPTSNLRIDKNEPFTDAGPDFFDNPTNIGKTVVQIRPQNITVKLRKDQPYKVNVTFRKVIDYPLDIYYVMDLSYSMNDDLKVLQDLGTSLFDDLKRDVTDNVQLGFGSFVDKVMMPYASTVPEQLQNPCASQPNKTTCATPFGFRHQASITGNATSFNEAIQSTEISGNIDIPEGSFDALMQIAVCEHIKWRDGATRVILLTTDATPHIAMDGKLAAILEANDMKCHLRKGANSRLPDAIVYEKSKTMDYPSFGQLKDAFQLNKIHSIFAVTKEVLPLYRGIETLLSNAYLAELLADSSNIIPLINETYSKLKGRLVIETSPKVLPAHVKQTFRIFCPNSANATNEEMKCEGIEIGDEVVIEFEFTATECPTDPNRRDKVLLTSSSLRDEVTINLEYLCECDCQSEGLANSSDCNHSGSLTCGVCKCDSGKEGSLCQCDAMKNGVLVKDSCKMAGSDKYCEDRGFCDCGECKHCEYPYTGKYCECTTIGCPSIDGGVCGGEKQGYCKICPNLKEKCHCHAPYSIKQSDGTCSCHPDKCKTLTTNGTCDGHGECNCDTCECHESIWTGSHCQTCNDPKCIGVDATCSGEDIRKCALCQTKRDDCADVCNTRTDVLLYSKKTSFLNCDACLSSSTSRDCKDCANHDSSVAKTPCTHLRDLDSCKYEYEIFWTTQNQYAIYVKTYDKENDCPTPVNALYIVFPVVGGIVLIGILALIIWKVLATLRDKRQYEAFIEEEKKRKWTKGENPIFERPDQKFSNPMFDAKNADG